jgi:bifunctional DNA-binding transcriptional regulator/antitoxin component of YhaV-PrlF toxin-antitoxin module
MKDKSDKGGEPTGPKGEPDAIEESSVYARGQTVIPKMIREALAIEYGTKLHWEVREGVIHVMPLPKNPVQASIGFLKGKGLTYAQFMKARRSERERERKREAEEQRRWSTSSIRQP